MMGMMYHFSFTTLANDIAEIQRELEQIGESSNYMETAGNINLVEDVCKRVLDEMMSRRFTNGTYKVIPDH